MTPVIDENGRVFGRVNIVDALIILGVILAAISAAALIHPGLFTASSTTITVTGTFETIVHPDTVDELHPDLRGDGIRVTSIHGTERVQVPLNGDDTAVPRTRVVFAAALPTVIEADTTGVERTYWVRDGGQQRLVIGQEYTIDFGRMVVDAVLTDMEVAS